MLGKEQFSAIVELTPLVSMDLIIEDLQQRILVGLRTNRPAQGYWFVPGGRILKGETLRQAFERISHNELGIVLSMDASEPLGALPIFIKITSVEKVSLPIMWHWVIG